MSVSSTEMTKYLKIDKHSYFVDLDDYSKLPEIMFKCSYGAVMLTDYKKFYNSLHYAATHSKFNLHEQRPQSFSEYALIFTVPDQAFVTKYNNVTFIKNNKKVTFVFVPIYVETDKTMVENQNSGLLDHIVSYFFSPEPENFEDYLTRVLKESKITNAFAISSILKSNSREIRYQKAMTIIEQHDEQMAKDFKEEYQLYMDPISNLLIEDAISYFLATDLTKTHKRSLSKASYDKLLQSASRDGLETTPLCPITRGKIEKIFADSELQEKIENFLNNVETKAEALKTQKSIFSQYFANS